MDEFKEITKLMADKTSEIIKSYFRTNINVESKKDDSPVTIADKKSEEIIREIILKYFPDHGIIGEEFGTFNENAEYKWIIDPIDGTQSFIHGATTFGTLIALVHNNKPILGAFNQPILGEFLIGDNEQTTLNGKIVKVSSNNELSQATLSTTDIFNIKKYHNLDKFLKLSEQAKLFRMWGDAYGYYLVATGFMDIMIDPIMNIWDSMALIPIINGAGGIITDYYGNESYELTSTIACNNKELLKQVLNILHQ
jgi:myo-inositol-1(or 4)-monophosphatase